jgi:hypothetical protein
MKPVKQMFSAEELATRVDALAREIVADISGH